MLGEANNTNEIMAKRTAKNSVFLDLFQDKKNLLKLYRTLHPEDTTATEDSLTDVTIEICKDRDVLREYLSKREKEVVTIMMSLFDEEEIMKMFGRSERHDEARLTAERMIRKGKMSLEEIADYVPSLSMEELKELEAEVMQLS